MASLTLVSTSPANPSAGEADRVIDRTVNMESSMTNHDIVINGPASATPSCPR